LFRLKFNFFWLEGVSGRLIANGDSTQTNKGNILVPETIMDSATIAR